jgi:Acetyltransferase (GNAT) domain
LWRIRNVRHDVALSTTRPLECRPLRTADQQQIAALYWQLYGEKHSRLNPRFTADFLAHGLESGVLHGEGILCEGRLVAAFLAYSVADVMTNPVFGYDTSLPQQLGLYRRLSVLTLQYARDRGRTAA